MLGFRLVPTSCDFEYGDDETQITGYIKKGSGSCPTDIEIPDGVTHIAEDAFKDKGLTLVTFPESVEDIGANAFAGNTFSSHVYIPNESATVGDNAFDSSVIVAKEGTDSCFEISNNALSDYYCGREVTVPDGVISIEANTFENKGLTSVTLPDSLRQIGDRAFYNNMFTSITVPSLNALVGSDIFDGDVLVTPSSFIFQLGETTIASGGSNSGSERCYSVVLDALGNIYCAGYTNGGVGETNGGNNDAFVMKLNSSGDLQWVTQLGATTLGFSGGNNSETDRCYSVAVDDSGNIYCAGYTDGALGEANGGGNDAFVMKLNSSGTIQWVTQLGDTTLGFSEGDNAGYNICYSVALDDSGNIYCAGSTTGDLGEASGGNNDVFIMKLNSSGDIEWVTQLGGTTTANGGSNSGGEICDSIALDASGNIYCGGSTNGGLGEAYGGGNYDAFVMKLNSSGDIEWVTQLGGTTIASGGNNSGDEACHSIAVDASGNSYCAGYTSGALGEANGGGADAFVMKLNSSGDLQWVKQLGGTTIASGGNNSGNEVCDSIALDASGNSYCAGYTEGAFGEMNGGGKDAFVMKLDSSGDLQWVTQLGDTTLGFSGGDNSGNDRCYSVALDASGNIYCAGYTEGALGETNGETNGGSYDVFIMKLTSDGELF